MSEILVPALRAGGITAFALGLVFLLIDPPSFAGLEGMFSILAGAALFVLLTAALVVLATGKEMPEPEFRKLVDRSEALARLPAPDYPPSDFDLLVMEALDALPAEFQEVLDRTPVVISHLGAEHRAYGHYMGGTVANDGWPTRIVIYQDTLERDFGHDPELLRAQVQRTVRHEVAHHLGWGESGVRALGL